MISGWAKGKYTGKNVSVQVKITGTRGVKGAQCHIQITGEDEAMINPALDEISTKLIAWLCPHCNGILQHESVEEMKMGMSIKCPFCGVTIDRSHSN